MNFFKSVFTDENPDQEQQKHDESISTSQSTQNEPTWGFVGGFIKTIATKSESVLETYRRDLEEFSTGLKSETQVLKDVASSKAQESIQSVGNAFDSFGSVVGQIINQSGNLIDGPDHEVGSDSGSGLGKYSRFEVQLKGIQSDMSMFVEEPEDLGEYEKWRGGFDLEGKKEEIEGLIEGDGSLSGIYKRVVPNMVDHEVFWLRYYFRVFKLEQAESVRTRLVELANVDEDLSWDVDDDDVEDVKKVVIDENEDEKAVLSDEKVVFSDEKAVLSGEEVVLSGEKVALGEEKAVLRDEKAVSSGEEVVLGGEKAVLSDEKAVLGSEKVVLSNEKEVCQVSKDGVSIVLSQPSSRGEEEEDFGWDEIGDLGSEEEDEKEMKQSEGTNNREELRKRLSVVEEDENLSWDIEDDDEPIKKS